MSEHPEVTAYNEGASNRVKGITKLNSHSHIKDTDWSRRDANRRGWGDMDTFITMATIFSKK